MLEAFLSHQTRTNDWCHMCLSCRYGWFVLVVEMLGATSTITYGLNIVCDPVHEPLEYEADAPGITKVCLSP